MNRLRFRVWDKEVQEFAHWPVYFNLTNSEIVTELWYGYEIQVEEPLQDSNYIVQQSTGLFDKNGKEIFEGDILKEDSTLGIVIFGRYLDYEYIRYGLDGWLFSEKLKYGFVDTPLTEYVLDPNCSMEVVGNKFEHPHLLGED